MPDKARDSSYELPDSDTDLPDRLYHYTDINGLKGIYETGQIYATNSLYLNDTSEISLGIAALRDRLYQQELSYWRERVAISERNLDRTKTESEEPQEPDPYADIIAELEEIRHAIEEVGEYSQFYISCLTTEEDQLSQWRGYASGGYSVGFDTKQLLQSLSEDQSMRRVQYYDDRTTEQYAERMVSLAKKLRNAIDSYPEAEGVDSSSHGSNFDPTRDGQGIAECVE
jgi:hypothetical protein